MVEQMDRVHSVARLALTAAPGNLDQLDQFIAENVPDPLPVQTAYEILLQSYLFFGYPQAIEALRIFSTIITRLGLNLDQPGNKKSENADLQKRGEQLCREIYHPNYERLIDNMRNISSELATWMVMEGYGRVLSRPGPLKLEREIASIVFLICSGHPVQLFSHVRGARNLGASAEELLSIIETIGLTTEQIQQAKSTLQRVFTL